MRASQPCGPPFAVASCGSSHPNPHNNPHHNNHPIPTIQQITGYVDTTYHLKLDPLHIALWAIPTAVCAFVIHGWRMLRLDRHLDAMARQPETVATTAGSEAR